MPMLVLCLLCALAMTAQPALVGSMSGSEPAQQEELTLLFHGALQLSQALNGVYKATEAQLIKAQNIAYTIYIMLSSLIHVVILFPCRHYR